MTTANISSYAFNSSNDIFYTAAGSRTNAQNLNSIRDEINKVAKQSLDNSSPNPVSPSVVLDMSGTAKTLLKN